MSFKLLVFDTHPVQYRVPVWQTIDAGFPGCVHVVYASDCSIRGYADVDFGRTFAWDEPLLSGYQHTILNCEKGKPLNGWKSLTGRGVREQIKRIKPDAILLTGLNYRFDLVAFLYARLNNIPLWLRYETQDHAFRRSAVKALIRSIVYRIAYRHIERFFFIGELNRTHFLDHGVPVTKLKPACYSTVDRFGRFSDNEKMELRYNARRIAKIDSSDFVVGFSGKFIDKKNPEVLFDALKYIPEELRCKMHLYFVGSGPLGSNLRILASLAFKQFGVRTHFAGFVNQTELVPHYLAMDVLVLPSRRMGETWGLVANEAMQAGCGVVVSDAVGCGADFNSWERFKIFEEENATKLAECIEHLSRYPRDFNWAQQRLKRYSIDATADALLEEVIANREYRLSNEPTSLS
jgi:glycosyltransferase involved in cell wall biosynthesis